MGIAESVAQRIADGDVSKTIHGKKLIKLDTDRIFSAEPPLSGQYEGVLKLLAEIKQSGNVILFIDKFHELVGSVRSLLSADIERILKPALAQGEIQVRQILKSWLVERVPMVSITL